MLILPPFRINLKKYTIIQLRRLQIGLIVSSATYEEKHVVG